MYELRDKAAARMAEECQGKEHLIPFEEYLMSIMTDAVALKILVEDKTLEGAYEKMKDIARKRAVNGAAYIPPEEGFEIIRSYYGIEEEDLHVSAASQQNSVIDIFDYM